MKICRLLKSPALGNCIICCLFGKSSSAHFHLHVKKIVQHLLERFFLALAQYTVFRYRFSLIRMSILSIPIFLFLFYSQFRKLYISKGFEENINAKQAKKKVNSIKFKLEVLNWRECVASYLRLLALNCSTMVTLQNVLLLKSLLAACK